jgi:hypothetical protein
MSCPLSPLAGKKAAAEARIQLDSATEREQPHLHAWACRNACSFTPRRQPRLEQRDVRHGDWAGGAGRPAHVDLYVIEEPAVIEGQRPVGRENILLVVPVPLRRDDWRDESIAICLGNRRGSGVHALTNPVENISLLPQRGHDLRTRTGDPVILVPDRHLGDPAERVRDGAGQDDLAEPPVAERRFAGRIEQDRLGGRLARRNAGRHVHAIEIVESGRRQSGRQGKHSRECEYGLEAHRAYSLLLRG